VICGMMMMNVKVASDDELTRRGSSKRKERISLQEKWGMV